MILRFPPGVQSQECIEAHTNVDIVVNLEEFQALLNDRLPLVFGGTPVSEAEIPWPSADDEDQSDDSATTS